MNINYLAERISWLLDFAAEDFSVIIQDDKNNIEEVGVKARDDSLDKLDIQKIWAIPKEITIDIKEEEFRKNIKGKIYAGTKPMPPRYRGITLYSNHRMINERSFFGKIESSHFFSYISGWIELNFIDEQREDLISTNRQSLNWDTLFL